MEDTYPRFNPTCEYKKNNGELCGKKMIGDYLCTIHFNQKLKLQHGKLNSNLDKYPPIKPINARFSGKSNLIVIKEIYEYIKSQISNDVTEEMLLNIFNNTYDKFGYYDFIDGYIKHEALNEIYYNCDDDHYNSWINDVLREFGYSKSVEKYNTIKTTLINNCIVYYNNGFFWFDEDEKFSKYINSSFDKKKLISISNRLSISPQLKKKELLEKLKTILVFPTIDDKKWISCKEGCFC